MKKRWVRKNLGPPPIQIALVGFFLFAITISLLAVVQSGSFDVRSRAVQTLYPPSQSTGCPDGGANKCDFSRYYASDPSLLNNRKYCRNESDGNKTYTCTKVKGTVVVNNTICPDYYVRKLVENCSKRTDGKTSCTESGNCYQYGLACPDGGANKCDFGSYYRSNPTQLNSRKYCRNESDGNKTYTCVKVKGPNSICPDYYVRKLVENCSARTDGKTSCTESGNCYQWCSDANCLIGKSRCNGSKIEKCVKYDCDDGLTRPAGTRARTKWVNVEDCSTFTDSARPGVPLTCKCGAANNCSGITTTQACDIP